VLQRSSTANWLRTFLAPKRQLAQASSGQPRYLSPLALELVASIEQRSNALKKSLIICLSLLPIAAGGSWANNGNSPPNGGIESIPDRGDELRLLPVTGALNVRELGGVHVKGGLLPYGRFIRAADLARLTDADRQVIHEHGVATDIDLRSPDEVAKAPDALTHDHTIRYSNVPFFGAAPPDASVTDINAMYLHSLENNQPQYREIFETIARAGPGAVLYHCTAGKDRTGMISAILLALAGTPRAEIVHNYALSGQYIKPMLATPAIQQTLKEHPDLKPMMRSPPAAIETYLNALDQKYGGAESYLTMIGVNTSDVAAIRRRLSP
jgi:protein-tyrosine phosphatase